MKQLMKSLKVMFGADPVKPAKEEISPDALKIHVLHRGNKERVAMIRQELEEKHANPPTEKFRLKRWAVLAAVNLLFVVSYVLDIQMLEGAMTASRFVGFHMADLNSSLQVMLAFKEVVLNLMIGTVTLLIAWWLLGGRTFCSWACPYHLLSEWAEMLHLKLVDKKIVKDHPFDRRARTWFWVIFVVLAVVSGYTVYETISPTGIVSRALIYGPGLALIWVALLLVFEIFYSQRAWCRYACPIGLTYGLVGATSPLVVRYKLENCLHEGECRRVCLVPHALDTVLKGRAVHTDVEIGADCTRCGRCVEACPTGSLKFRFKGLGKKD